MQHQNAKNTQLREQKLPDFTNVGNNVINNYPVSVLIGDLSPRQPRTACSPCHEVGITTIHRPMILDQRHTKFAMCTSQKRIMSHCRPSGGSNLA